MQAAAVHNKREKAELAAQHDELRMESRQVAEDASGQVADLQRQLAEMLQLAEAAAAANKREKAELAAQNDQLRVSIAALRTRITFCKKTSRATYYLLLYITPAHLRVSGVLCAPLPLPAPEDP
eukprot:3743907-Pyramimonas_sp.AAC.2